MEASVSTDDRDLEIPAFLRICNTGEPGSGGASPAGVVQVVQAGNPKTLMGQRKVPMLSVIPPAALIHFADAMRYGAFEAPRADGSKGYGPYNWREQASESMVYVDAALRHIESWVDGEEKAPDSLAHHLGHAMATLGILLDAIEHDLVIDTRPKVRSNVASRMLAERTRKV